MIVARFADELRRDGAGDPTVREVLSRFCRASSATRSSSASSRSTQLSSARRLAPRLPARRRGRRGRLVRTSPVVCSVRLAGQLCRACSMTICGSDEVRTAAPGLPRSLASGSVRENDVHLHLPRRLLTLRRPHSHPRPPPASFNRARTQPDSQADFPDRPFGGKAPEAGLPVGVRWEGSTCPCRGSRFSRLN